MQPVKVKIMNIKPFWGPLKVWELRGSIPCFSPLSVGLSEHILVVQIDHLWFKISKFWLIMTTSGSVLIGSYSLIAQSFDCLYEALV